MPDGVVVTGNTSLSSAHTGCSPTVMHSDLWTTVAQLPLAETDAPLMIPAAMTTKTVCFMGPSLRSRANAPVTHAVRQRSIRRTGGLHGIGRRGRFSEAAGSARKSLER